MLLSLRAKAVLCVLVAVLCSVWAQADEADDQYAVAAGHYAQKRWKFAAEEFQTFLDKYPQHPKANQGVFFLAEALTQLGQLDEAAARFRDYLSREPDGPLAAPALFRSGEAAYLSGKLGPAKIHLERFLATYPDHELNAYVLPYLGDIAASQHDTASAERYFRQGLTQFPHGTKQDECRFGLAQALEKQGKSEEAERFYLAVAAKPGSPLADDAQFHLGALQYAAGRLEEALETFHPFESRLANSRWQPTARLGRGWALLKLGRLAEAKSAFQSAASDAKVGVEARYWLGLTLKSEKNWQAAAQTLLDAAEEHPNDKLAGALRFHAGDSLFHAGDTAGAEKQFDLVIAASPDNEWADDAMRGKLRVALQKEDYSALDSQAAQFAARFPKSPFAADVQRMLAQSLVQRKEHERAVEVLEPLVAAGQPQDGVLEDRYLLSVAYESLDRYQDALDVLRPVLKSAAGKLRRDAQLVQASLLMKLKRFDEAIGPLEAFLGTKPTGDEAAAALGNLANCYAQTNQLDKAKQRYAELLEKHPGHELIAPTTEQLAEAAYEAGDVAWANKMFAYLAADGRSPRRSLEGLSGLGWSQYKAGQLEEAADTFDQLLTKGPDPSLEAETALIRGQILQQLGRPDPALAMYDLIIDHHQKTEQFPQALWRAALLRDNLEQNQEAALLYERLAGAYPQFPEIDALLYNWAWVLHDLGRGEESNKLFERLRKEHPKSSYWADATFRLAQQAFKAKDYEHSQKLVADLLSDDPSPEIRQNSLYLQGQIAAAQEQWDQAGRSFKTLVHDYPESSARLMAEYGIAEAVFRQNDYEKAVELFDRLLRQTKGRDEPWLAVIHLRLAQALCHQKKWDEAYEIASKIEAEYPSFEEQYEVDYVLGRCLSNRAEFELARKTYRKVIRSPQGAKTETAAKAQLMIAESYYHQKNYQAALREYLALEILYGYPTWQAAALLQAAKCHEMLGEWKQAVDLYDRLLTVYPDTSFVEEATARLRAARQRMAAKPAS